MPKNYFERVAERYDESTADLSAAAVVEPVVDFLVDLARWVCSRTRHRHRPHRPTARERGIRVMASICRRRWSPGCGRNPAPRRSV